MGYTISRKQTGTWVTLLVVIAASFIVEPDLHKWALFWVFRVMFALVGWGLTVVLGTLRGVVL